MTSTIKLMQLDNAPANGSSFQKVEHDLCQGVTLVIGLIRFPIESILFLIIIKMK